MLCRLYSEFYDSDIIIASPLGLRRVIGAPGDKKRDVDFLSSIEVVIMDHADVFLYQNWEHVRDAFAVLNALPSATHDTDFSRVREWNLAGLAKYFRQTIVFSSYMEADITHLMRKLCFNAAGGMLVRGTYAGSITRVVPTVRQAFQRITPTSLADADEARFAFFSARILPELMSGIADDAGSVRAHTLIYVPSYFDYVRLRNLLDAKELEFVTCSECVKKRTLPSWKAWTCLGVYKRFVCVLKSALVDLFRGVVIRASIWPPAFAYDAGIPTIRTSPDRVRAFSPGTPPSC